MTVLRLAHALQPISDRALGADYKIGLDAIESGTGRLVPSATTEFNGEGIAFRSGDLLFGKLRPYLAKAWLADRDGSAVGDFLVLRPKPIAAARYMNYVLLSDSFLKPVTAAVTGAKMPRTDWTAVKNSRVDLPPLDEQCAIADYLDRETAQIDALVAKQLEFIELLVERRSAVSDREFQRVEGKRHTTVRQALIRVQRVPVPGSGVVTAYRDGVVTLRANRRVDGYTMSEAEAGYQGVLVGDVVFHALDGFSGAVGISDSLGQCTPVYHVCRPRYDDDADYLALLIRYLGKSGFLATQAPSTRQRSVDFRNWGTFARVPLMLPSVDHQKAFVLEYRERTSRIGTLIAKAKEHIALAKERRSALITAAVTGQIDVGAASQKAG